MMTCVVSFFSLFTSNILNKQTSDTSKYAITVKPIQDLSSSVAPSLPVQESVQRLFASLPPPPNRSILWQFSQIFLRVKSQII